MAKPTTLPRWADVGGAIAVPASGKLDVGWVTAERPPAQYMNWWMNLVYQWTLYLNQFFSAAGTVTDAIHTAGVSNLDGLVTAGAGVTCAVNQSVTVSGTGAYKHGTFTESFSAILGRSTSSATAWATNGSGYGIQGNAPLLWCIPIVLPVGERILAIRIRLKCGGGSITCTAYQVSNANGSATIGSGITSTTLAFETVTIGSLTTVMTAGTTVQVNMTGGTGTSEYVYVEVDYDRP